MKNFNKNNIVGIEPCKNVEKITRKKGLKTHSLYWNSITEKFLLKKYGRFDLIFSANTISHIKDLNKVFESINSILTDNGTLIIEDPSLLSCLKTNTYDQFYNEHIYVFSCVGLQKILKKNNLEIYKDKNINVHGGSNRYYIKKTSYYKKIENSYKTLVSEEIKYGLKSISTYIKFANRVKISRSNLLNLFKKIKIKKKKIIGYGATAKSTTILNYCNINGKYIDYFLDTTPDKQNKYTPGTKIKIKKYKNGIEKDVNFVFLGAWNFKNEIANKESEFVKNGGKFITHVPEVMDFS